MNKIKSFRKEKLLTLNQVADILGVTTAAVSHWESGRSEPTLGNLKLLSELFEVPLEALTETKPEKIYLQAEKNMEIDKILMDAETRIAQLLEVQLSQITVSYTYTKK
jgi:transcriptional regulator with XRE-family HTH domain